MTGDHFRYTATCLGLCFITWLLA